MEPRVSRNASMEPRVSRNAPMEPRASGLGMCRNAGKTYRLSDAIRRLSPPRAPGHRDLATRR